MRNIFRPIFFPVLTCLASCAPSALVPCAPNAPDLEGKKDCNMSVQGNWEHAEVQTSYSPAKHMGILMNGYRGLFQGGQNYMWQCAGGYYLKKWNKKFDVFGGFGMGRHEVSGDWGVDFMHGGGNSGEIKSRFYDIFLQSDCYGRISDEWTFTFTLQYSAYHFSRFEYELTTESYTETQWMDHKYRLNCSNQHQLLFCSTFKKFYSPYFAVFLQPGLRLGFPFDAEVDQTSYYIHDTGTYAPSNIAWNASRLFFNTGLIFHFDKNVKKRNVQVF